MDNGQLTMGQWQRSSLLSPFSPLSPVSPSGRPRVFPFNSPSAIMPQSAREFRRSLQ